LPWQKENTSSPALLPSSLSRRNNFGGKINIDMRELKPRLSRHKERKSLIAPNDILLYLEWLNFQALYTHTHTHTQYVSGIFINTGDLCGGWSCPWPQESHTLIDMRKPVHLLNCQCIWCLGIIKMRTQP
jgi:hypothetical protein